MGFREDNIESYNAWMKKQEDAKKFMQTRTGNKILIEVAAQHPLVEGMFPNEEFAKIVSTKQKTLSNPLNSENKRVFNNKNKLLKNMESAKISLSSTPD